MHAIVRVAGVQARVSPGDRVILPRLDAEVGAKATFDVLLLSDGEAVTVGTPVVEGASVEAEVLEHARDKKIIVFKKKRRKRYRRTAGHRQRYTAVRITGIVGPDGVRVGVPGVEKAVEEPAVAEEEIVAVELEAVETVAEEAVPAEEAPQPDEATATEEK